MFRLLSGVLNQPKYLPIRYMPMTIELLLVDDFADAVVSYFPTPVAGKENIAAANTIFEDWAIENCEIKVDLCTLDNSITP